MLTNLVALFASALAADAVFRSLLFVSARRTRRETQTPTRVRTLVVIPSRDEGEAVAKTIESARGADVLLLLDGHDEVAEAAARALGAQIVVKEPAGPTKAAALASLAREHRALIESFDVVLLLDVGSTLTPSFFDSFNWPADADAVQTILEGGTSAAADSERHAQSVEDHGRQNLGWNVRLRGTGSAFRAQTFLELAPQLVTRCEDLEASLLLHASKIRMSDAVVIDEKPESVRDAASQRARWLVGRYELLFRRAPQLAEAIAHKPTENLAFLAEIFGRPLSLTVPLRAVAGLWLISRGHRVTGAAIAATTLIDVALVAGRTSPAAAMKLAASWLAAAAMAPKAVLNWTKVERP